MEVESKLFTISGIFDWIISTLQSLFTNPYVLALFLILIGYLLIRKIVGYVTTTPALAHTVVICFGSIALILLKVVRYVTQIGMSLREELFRRFFNAKWSMVRPVKLVTDGPYSNKYHIVMPGDTAVPLDIDGKTKVVSGKNKAKDLSLPMEVWMSVLVKRLLKRTSGAINLIAVYVLSGGTGTATCKVDLASNVKGALGMVQNMLPIIITPIRLSGQRLDNLTYLAENVWESTIGKAKLFGYIEQDSQRLTDEKVVDEHVSQFISCLSIPKPVLGDGLGNIISNLGAKWHIFTLAILEGFSLSSMELIDLRRELRFLRMGGDSTLRRVHLRRPFEEGINFNVKDKDVSLVLTIPTTDRKNFENENRQLLDLVASVVETEAEVRVVTKTAVPIRHGAEPRLFLLVPLTEAEWTATELGRYCPMMALPLEQLLTIQRQVIRTKTTEALTEAAVIPIQGGDKT